MDAAQAMKSGMALNLSVFREPRGVMRLIQFVFSICAFATTTGFSSYVEFSLKATCEPSDFSLDFSYPFRLDHIHKAEVACNIANNTTTHPTFRLLGDFSSDAQFFVATGVLSFLYCIGIIVVYVLFDSMYQNNAVVPLADFVLTVILAVFWLSGSAAWANGLIGLKSTTDPELIKKLPACTANDVCKSVSVGSFSNLNISVILGFLNFFLWASDLWFLYKETTWFKLRQVPADMGTTA